TPLPPPRAGFSEHLAPHDRAGLDEVLGLAIQGGPERVERGLRAFIERTGANELMLTSMIYDHAARLRSYEISAGVAARLADWRPLFFRRDCRPLPIRPQPGERHGPRGAARLVDRSDRRWALSRHLAARLGRYGRRVPRRAHGAQEDRRAEGAQPRDGEPPRG